MVYRHYAISHCKLIHYFLGRLIKIYLPSFIIYYKKTNMYMYTLMFAIAKLKMYEDYTCIKYIEHQNNNRSQQFQIAD